MRKILWVALSCLLPGTLSSQNTYIPIGSDEYKLVDRIETTEWFINRDFSTALKPLSRRDIAYLASEYKEFFQLTPNTVPNAIDIHNADRAYNISGEWGKPNVMYSDATERRHRPILKYFYQTEPNLLQYGNENFFFALNPVLYAQAGLENNHSELKYIFMRGAEVRARILRNIGIYTVVAETQEKFPNYFTTIANKHRFFPGFDFYSGGTSKRPFDGLYARGYVDFPVYKDYITATFGYDKNFIGDGYRSLLLGSSGAPATFLRLRYNWRGFTYQNLYMELIDDFSQGGDRRLPKKYASIHYLSMNIGRRLNLGLFESTVFNRHNAMDIYNFIPVIYGNTLHRAWTGQHQTSLGLTFKALPWNNFQVYGQGFANSIDFRNFSEGSWKNQFATQLGIKYTNAFTLRNLDLQLEWNAVRPWTYTAQDSITNYTHYNQPLAHPLGSGFQEWIASFDYQPIKDLRIGLTGIYSIKNSKEATGEFIYQPSSARMSDFGYAYLDAGGTAGLFINLNGAYELMQNLYLEAGVSYMDINEHSLQQSFMFYTGIRWNMQRRVYDFW